MEENFNNSSLILYTLFLLIFYFSVKFLSKYYLSDYPDISRKFHISKISQIGGLLISCFFSAVLILLNEIPNWFFVGGVSSILLGAFDDKFDLPWFIKLFVQLLIVAFLTYTFWEEFNQLSFYGYLLPISQIGLLTIFVFWFVGIYNAVNLIDGLDGLAGGFMIIICIAASILNNGIFSQINLLLVIILSVFMLFNQRPAKVFMGDAGSLFLGYYVAVLPLLHYDLGKISSPVLNMTPFILLVFFLVADTTRVFFTRLVSGKSPMTGDTIHFHHLVIQNSGSYLATLFVIYFVTFISGVFAALSGSYSFSQTGMLIHLSLIFLFVLTPPTPTYVSFITQLVNPIYQWDKRKKNTQENWAYAGSIMMLLFLLIISLFFQIDITQLFSWQYFFAFSLLILFIYLNRGDSIVIPTLQIFITILILGIFWYVSLNIFSQLFTILLLISVVIFTFKRVSGTALNQYSALDLLMFFISIGSIIISFNGLLLNPWLYLMNFAVWLGVGFTLRHVIY